MRKFNSLVVLGVLLAAMPEVQAQQSGELERIAAAKQQFVATIGARNINGLKPFRAIRHRPLRLFCRIGNIRDGVEQTLNERMKTPLSTTAAAVGALLFFVNRRGDVLIPRPVS
jgi:hypothetical protein